MAELDPLSDSEREFLEAFIPGRSPESRNGRGAQLSKSRSLPVVTLTYAQSMDSMIASAPGERTTLSGKETKSMTHYLRINHSAILVGAGTAVADDPGLNSRYPGADLTKQPLPIVLDPHERWSGDALPKVVQLAKAGQGHAPIWITGNPQHRDWAAYDDISKRVGHEKLPVYFPLPEDGRWDWHALLCNIKQLGCDSVMIEGGATIINELLARPDLVDSVIVTIAPTWLGVGGVNVVPGERREARQGTSARMNSASLTGTTWRQFGQDAVVCGRLLHHGPGLD